MKKYNIIALAAIAVACAFVACSNEEDDIFDQTAAERLNTISSIYTQRLADSPGGWVMEYYPYGDNEDLITGVGYLIMNRFHDNGSVFTMMKNAASRNNAWTDSTAWEVITDMGPVLTFDTYNVCYGRFSDPYDLDLTPGTYDDESGKGFQGDYEFVMVDVPENGDHIMLKGKKRGLYHRLTRIPVGTDFEAYLDDISHFNSTHFIVDAPWELTLTDNGVKYRVNSAYKMCPMIYEEGKDSTTYGWLNPFLVTKCGDQYRLRFKDTVMVDTYQMEQEFAYDAEKGLFRGVRNAENIIEGYPAINFFEESVANMHTWTLSKNGEKSEKLQAIFDALETKFSQTKDSRNRTYSFVGINFGRNSILRDGVRDTLNCWNVIYRAPGSSRNTTVSYVFDIDYTEGETAVFQYKEPLNDASGKVLNAFPEINEMLGLFSRRFAINEVDSKFNLTHVMLSAADDPDTWMILNY